MRSQTPPPLSDSRRSDAQEADSRRSDGGEGPSRPSAPASSPRLELLLLAVVRDGELARQAGARSARSGGPRE
eukprot:305862-Prorocentrum_minimum.AAC.3